MNQKPNKTCRVCGDSANCYSYNGDLSCKSCRMFFRRNVEKITKLVCFKNNDCIITKETRKDCSKCRFEQCLKIGMKTSKTISKSSKNVLIIFKEIENLPRLRQALNKSSTLTNYELKCIKNVNQSFKYFVNESTLNFSNIVPDDIMENLPMANMRAYIRQMLRYLMKVNLFKTFPKNKQIDIIKNASYSFAAIRCAASYDPEEETYVVYPDESSNIGYKMKANSLQEAIDDQDGLDENMAIVINLNKFLSNDETITNLISSVSVAISVHCFIKSEYLRYAYAVNCYLLQRYLEVTYTKEAGFNLYCQLMQMVHNTFESARDAYFKWIEESGTNEMEEIFDEL